MQQCLNRRVDPHGHGSFRPSRSTSSLSPWTTRSPRFTWVSLGEPPAPLAHRLKTAPRRRVPSVDLLGRSGSVRLQTIQLMTFAFGSSDEARARGRPCSYRARRWCRSRAVRDRVLTSALCPTFARWCRELAPTQASSPMEPAGDPADAASGPLDLLAARRSSGWRRRAGRSEAPSHRWLQSGTRATAADRPRGR